MIDSTARVSPDADIAKGVEIGPFCVIDAGVKIGKGCRIQGHVWLTGKTQLGENNVIGYGSVIGSDPQDLQFDSSISSNVVMGDHNTLREYVTIHRSSQVGQSTQIGNGNYLMSHSHLGHDSTIGNENILANNVMVAGYVTIGDKVFLGGGGGFHQFVNVGSYSVVQGNSSVSQDVPPYCMAHGQNKLLGLNVVGLKRAGFNSAQRKEIKELYKLFFQGELPRREAIEQAKQRPLSPQAQVLLDAVEKASRKGVMGH